MRQQPRTNNTSQRSSESRLTAGGGAPAVKYGDIDESDFVHEEIKELGVIARQAAKQMVGRPQDEEALYQQLLLSGPSKESIGMLKKEKDAARSAAQSGIYVTYRKDPTYTGTRYSGSRGAPKYGGRDDKEECIRIGPTHRCFCTHQLSDHHEPKVNSKTGRITHPKCTLCSCTGYSYIPNQPEEVGDGHLTRRKGFDLSKWSPKCKGCEHGSAHHDGGKLSKSCKSAGCRCPGFQSQFACVVCDCFWEDHETVFETRKERLTEGRTVDANYVPLAQVPGMFSELVFGENTSTCERQTLLPSTNESPVPHGQFSKPQLGNPASTRGQKTILPAGEHGEALLPAYCEFCAAVMRDPKAKFCSQCGGRRIG